MAAILVFLGAGFGGLMRWALGLLMGRLMPALGPAFGASVGVFMANVLGGFLMGLLTAYLLKMPQESAENWRLACAVGILGGFTTFSSFSLEMVRLYQAGQLLHMGIYALASVLLAFLALMGGLALGRALA